MAEADTPVRSEPSEPIDPDIDPAVATKRPRGSHGQGPILVVVAVGGAIGACARYGLGLAWPTAPGHFPWATLVINTVGCAVIGVFMVVITDVWAAHRLVRPFFGTGVLGGFTTFSTYAVDIQKLVNGDEARTGLLYLAGTLFAALAAVWLAATVTRRVIGWRQA